MYAKFFKRFIDIVISLIALVLLSVLLLVTGFIIKLVDPGPILFVSQRTGREGRIFDFYKFRSMPTTTDVVASDKLGEIKITWFGRFIRRSNLDELPQLWNILKGDMSITGPRPSLTSQTELIGLRRENGALGCRPGLTGLAQVNSYDGMPFDVKAKFDAKYAANITFLGDLKIFLQTFLYLTKPPPVY